MAYQELYFDHFQIVTIQMQHEIHAHTCSNPPGMYIKVVMNPFFIIISFVKILTLEFIGLDPYMCQE